MGVSSVRLLWGHHNIQREGITGRLSCWALARATLRQGVRHAFTAVRGRRDRLLLGNRKFRFHFDIETPFTSPYCQRL